MASNYLGNKILDHVLSGVAYAVPTGLKFKLWTSMPTNAGTGGSEVAGGSYAPVTMTPSLDNFAAAVGKTKTNAVAITYPQASAAWGAVAGMTVHDQDDNLLLIGTFTAPRSVAINDTLSFAAGQVTFTAV